MALLALMKSVGSSGAGRPHDRVVGSDDGAVGLDEERRLVRRRAADFPRVVAVVEADADDLADADQRTAEPRPPAHDGQPLDLHRAQAFEPGR